MIFVTAEGPCRYNPCLPGERETAPSLGVRLVNAGRKRKAKPVKSNRMTKLVGQATMDKTTKGVLRWRYTCTDRRCGVQNQPNPDDRLAQKGTVSRFIRHNADGRSLTKSPLAGAERPGRKRSTVLKSRKMDVRNRVTRLTISPPSVPPGRGDERGVSRQPTASPNGRDRPRSKSLRESRRIR